MVRRIYVEKKAPYAVRAKELKTEMSEYLGIDAATVRVLVRSMGKNDYLCTRKDTRRP